MEPTRRAIYDATQSTASLIAGSPYSLGLWYFDQLAPLKRVSVASLPSADGSSPSVNPSPQSIAAALAAQPLNYNYTYFLGISHPPYNLGESTEQVVG